MTEAVPRMGLSDGAGSLTYHVPISGDTELCKVKIGKDIHPVDAVLWTGVLHKYRLYALHWHSALDVPADVRPYSPEYATHVCRHPRTKAQHNAYFGFMQHTPLDPKKVANRQLS